MRNLLGLLTVSLVLLVATLAESGPRPGIESQPAAPNPPANERANDVSVPLDRSEVPPAPRRTPPAMMVEIEELLAAEKSNVEERRAEIARTADMARVADLLQEIHQLKVDTELEILRVQLRYAQLTGYEDQVREIEQAIEFMTSPRPVPEPEPRPASDTAGR
jgi:hypothetical protein